ADPQRLQLDDAAEGQPERDVDFEAGAVPETESGLRRDVDAEIAASADPFGRQDLLEEAVAVARDDRHRETDDVGAEDELRGEAAGDPGAEFAEGETRLARLADDDDLGAGVGDAPQRHAELARRDRRAAEQV